MLTPIASVFSPEAKQHALSATLVLEQMTDLPAEWVGARLEVLLEPPERLLLRTVYNGVPVTLCRVGDGVWLTPNTPPFSVLANPPGESRGAKGKPRGGLEPMILPFPPQQLALLPIFFQVKEGAPEQGLRTLEARLMPEIARNAGVEDWSARLSLHSAGQLARVRLVGPGWSLAAKVERLEFGTAFPAATWRPHGDAIKLDAQKVELWQRELSRQVEKYRPAASR